MGPQTTENCRPGPDTTTGLPVRCAVPYSAAMTAMRIFAQTEDIIARLEEAPTTMAVGHSLLHALAPLGVRGMFAGSFPVMPAARITELVAGCEVLAQISPHGWRDAYAHRDLHPGNPVILAPTRTTAPFLWSEGGLPSLRGWRGLNLARELGMEDGLAVPTPERAGRVGVLSLGFERFGLSPYERRMLQLLAIVAYERMRVLAAPPQSAHGGCPALSDPAAATDPIKALTERELECMRWVAEGKTDWEIGMILAISATTAKFHVDRARSKLGAATRPQAIAMLALRGML
jgi:LuxR family transcriptional regulator, quorum-sensing system regulator BjaR1